MTVAGVNDIYLAGEDLFARFLRIKVNSSQIYRVTVDAGRDLSEDLLYEGADYSSSDTVYAMADGSMLCTENGWKEVKVGRIFDNNALVKQGSEQAQDRMQLKDSSYCAHLGSHEDFKPMLESLLSKVEDKRIIFISDGAVWLSNWISEKYPEAVQILDFYHAFEHLSEATKFSDRNPDWLAEQKVLLLDSQLDIVLNNVSKLKGVNREKVSCLKQYFKKNRYRMDYAQYLAKGWCIGSGAIESAHRTLIQERMKLSGQRWGTNAQPLIKLRVAYASDKEHIVNQLFRSAA